VKITDPDPPGTMKLISTSTNSLTVSWNQTGAADRYYVAVDGEAYQNVNFSGIGTSNVTAVITAIIYMLPVSGASYCLNVTAFSFNVSSLPTTECNFTTSKLLSSF
jgi:hypothetical protein